MPQTAIPESATAERKARIKEFLARYFRNHELKNDEDIFALGFVNSLLAMQLVNFVEKEFAVAIEDEDLQAILDSTRDLPPVTRPADVTLVPLKEDAGPELSLVSTQALRKMLGQKEPQPEAKPKKLRDISGGFDPYNSG